MLFYKGVSENGSGKAGWHWHDLRYSRSAKTLNPVSSYSTKHWLGSVDDIDRNTGLQRPYPVVGVVEQVYKRAHRHALIRGWFPSQGAVVGVETPRIHNQPTPQEVISVRLFRQSCRTESRPVPLEPRFLLRQQTDVLLRALGAVGSALQPLAAGYLRRQHAAWLSCGRPPDLTWQGDGHRLREVVGRRPSSAPRPNKTLEVRFSAYRQEGGKAAVDCGADRAQTLREGGREAIGVEQGVCRHAEELCAGHEVRESSMMGNGLEGRIP